MLFHGIMTKYENLHWYFITCFQVRATDCEVFYTCLQLIKPENDTNYTYSLYGLDLLKSSYYQLHIK